MSLVAEINGFARTRTHTVRFSRLARHLTASRVRPFGSRVRVAPRTGDSVRASVLAPVHRVVRVGAVLEFPPRPANATRRRPSTFKLNLSELPRRC